MSAHPNILFVFTDQQTAMAMGAAGNRWVRTPHMDRLAAEGFRFEHSFCTSPVCGPSRASMATGLMPHQHGLVYNHDERFRDDDASRLPTFADRLREAGYGCYWTGKWHAQEFYPNRNERIHGFDFLAFEQAGFVGLGLDVDEGATGRAEQFLREPPREPWLLAVSWHNPHDICYWIMGEYMERLGPVTAADGDLPPLPANFEVSPDEPEFFKFCRERSQYGMEMLWTRDWDERRWRRYLAAYYRLVETIDLQLGRLLRALDASGQAENTLVVFTSDHGEGCAGHRFVVKLTPYEEAIRVPLVARWPGKIPAGEICTRHFASGVDLAPTFCDVAGVRSPSDACPGQSLVPFFGDPGLFGREFAVVNVDPDPERPGLTARAVRTRRWKYMAFSEGAPREALYDMENDPGETRNVAADPLVREALDAHREILRRWMSETTDTFPAPPKG